MLLVDAEDMAAMGHNSNQFIDFGNSVEAKNSEAALIASSRCTTQELGMVIRSPAAPGA